MDMDDGLLRSLWTRFFRYNWAFGLFLVLLFGIPRFVLILEANVSGTYNFAFIIFFLMWFTPFVFLTKKGRKKIGLKRPGHYRHLLVSFLLGVLSCAVVFGIFTLLYQITLDHAFVYILRSGGVPSGLADSDKLIYFSIAVIPCMLFSPIGEEFLYRGVVHGSFVNRFGEVKASFFDSLAFALTHLAHFGIIYDAGHWHFSVLPALLWVVCMFSVSQVFFRCKLLCDSITGAVLAHAGFNFAMMYFIFYWIY